MLLIRLMRSALLFACIGVLSLGIGEMGRGGVRAQSDDRVAFASDRDGNLEIYVMQPDGTDIQRLTHDPGQDIDPAWSPDRQQIAFVSNRDGSNFAIYLMNADGSNVRRVTPDDANYYTAPAWSPDGRYLALVSDRTGNLDVHILDLSSGTLRAVTDDPDEDNEPSWSPDGSRIAFSSFRTGYGEIYTVSASGGPVQALTSGSGADNLAPVWSPDGTQLAFVANSGLFSEIYIVNADGSNERNLITVDEYFIDSPSWSPDGQHITYQVSKPGEKATIRSIQADGNGARQVTVPDYESKWPSWSTPQSQTVIGIAISRPGTPDDVRRYPSIWSGLNFINLEGPGTQTYHQTIEPTAHRWTFSWCGTDADHLSELLAPFSIAFYIDERPVPASLLFQFDTDGVCRNWATILDGWRPGSQVTLDIRYHLSAPVRGGTGIRAAGDYTQRIYVTVKSNGGASADALACYAAPPSRVHVGMRAFLDGHGYDVNLRSENSYQSTRIRLLPSGTSVEIIGGPQCGADAKRTYVWWQVRVTSTNEIGWIAEGDSVQNPTVYVIVPAE